MLNAKPFVLIRGGGDLASGVALRLYHAGFPIVITELAQPLAVRRAVSFAETVYQGAHNVEDAASRLVKWNQVKATLDAGEIPVLVDPEADILHHMDFSTVVDARLLKIRSAPLPVEVPLHIGLGPGFHAGENCHAVVETRRSHTLGRVFWSGAPQQDTGQPEGDTRRVLRAPIDGILISHANIGDHLQEGQVVAEIQSSTLEPGAHLPGTQVPWRAGVVNRKPEIVSPFKGVLRGLIHDGREVTSGLKVGDVDPRDDTSACFLVSDKALAIGGGVLEAVLSRQ